MKELTEKQKKIWQLVDECKSLLELWKIDDDGGEFDQAMRLMGVQEVLDTKGINFILKALMNATKREGYKNERMVEDSIIEIAHVIIKNRNGEIIP